MQILRSKALISTIGYVALPLFAAIYPAVFHYANNARLVLLSSFLELCLLLAGAGLVIYFLLALCSRGKVSQAALGAALIVVFFYTYGFVFDGFRAIDLFQVETYNFMPFWIFAGLYLAWIVFGLSTRISTLIVKASTLVLGVLIGFNLVQIIPIEIEKGKSAAALDNGASAINTEGINQRHPDIYYLVFDEAAGFEVARQYWGYSGVDNLVNFLNENGFYVAEESHGGSIHTLRELSSRLNHKNYPVGDEHFDIYNEAIGRNSVMKYLKERGYTAIAYDQRRTPYPTMLATPADILIEESAEQTAGYFTVLDEYKILVLQSTLLRSILYQDPKVLHHRDMIFYTVKNVASTEVPSPKFVYVHLMLPHIPFAFTEDGTITASGQAEYTNWQRYFDNYKFFLRIAREMAENILLASQGKAVIIIQSDHGARNFTHYPYNGYLQDYPEEYKTWIVNTLYLPDCADAPLTQDLDPINTFPIVFNCYFEANLPLK